MAPREHLAVNLLVSRPHKGAPAGCVFPSAGANISNHMKTTSITIADGRTVTVRRMTWKAMRLMLRQLGQDIDALPRKEGRIVLLDNLPLVIANSEILAQMVITESTGVKPEELDQMDALSASELLRASVEINFDAEFGTTVGQIMGHVGDILTIGRKAS